jgi:hypothetical protein
MNSRAAGSCVVLPDSNAPDGAARLIYSRGNDRRANRIATSGTRPCAAKEMPMKTLIVSSLLLLACASSAATARTSPDSLAGPWRGTLVKGDATSAADFRFATGAGGDRGFYWGRALTPVSLTNVHLGQSVHFEIPQMGVFDGTADGDTMQGTFRDRTGEGSFTLTKQLDWDDPRNAP